MFLGEWEQTFFIFKLYTCPGPNCIHVHVWTFYRSSKESREQLFPNNTLKVISNICMRQKNYFFFLSASFIGMHFIYSIYYSVEISLLVWRTTQRMRCWLPPSHPLPSALAVHLGMSLFHLHFWKMNFVNVGFLVDSFFFFQQFKFVIPSSLAPTISKEKSAFNLIEGIPCMSWVIFFHAVYKMFFGLLTFLLWYA